MSLTLSFSFIWLWA